MIVLVNFNNVEVFMMKENFANLLAQLVLNDQVSRHTAGCIARAAGVEFDQRLIQLNESVKGIYQAFDLLYAEQSLTKKEESLFIKLVGLIEEKMHTTEENLYV